MALRRERTVMRDGALGCDELASTMAALGGFGGITTGLAVGSLHYGDRYTPRRMVRSALLGTVAGVVAFALYTHLWEPNCSRANRAHRGEPVGAVQRAVDWWRG